MSSASRAARAINEVLQLPDQDQQSLLEVIEDYFTVHDTPNSDSDMSDQEDEDIDLEDCIKKLYIIDIIIGHNKSLRHSKS